MKFKYDFTDLKKIYTSVFDHTGITDYLLLLLQYEPKGFLYYTTAHVSGNRLKCTTDASKESFLNNTMLWLHVCHVKHGHPQGIMGDGVATN